MICRIVVKLHKTGTMEYKEGILNDVEIFSWVTIKVKTSGCKTTQAQPLFEKYCLDEKKGENIYQYCCHIFR